MYVARYNHGTLRAALLAVLLLLSSRPSTEACSISPDPAAHVFQPASGAAPGHRPWIVLWNVKGAVKVKVVSAKCAKDKICAGKEVAVDKTGNYLRPRADLAASARIQVTSGKRLLTDVTISADPATELPAWDGVTLVSAKQEPEGLCSPAGPVVRLAIKPTKAKLDGTVALVYLSKPDPAQPQAKLALITGLGGSDGELMLNNGLGQTPWLKTVPTELWVMLADGDGHVGPAIRAI